MQTTSNPTKALEVNNMSSKGNKVGRPKLPGSSREEREAQKAYKAKQAELKAQEEKAAVEAAAAQGAAGGGGDEERQAQITEFNNFVRAVEAEAAAANAAAATRLNEAVAAENAHSAKAVPSSGKKGLFSNIPGSGVNLGESKQWRARLEAEQVKARVKAAGAENVQKARELLARLKSGENYAALVAERDAEGQQRQEASEGQEDRTSEAYLKRVAEVQEEQRLIKAAWKWYRSPGRPEEIRTKTSLYASHDSAEHEKWILPMYKQALAEAAAGRGSSE